jgi:hypothetical protein
VRLLRDLPNYRVSLSTKIVEYCALGVPVSTTRLPLAVPRRIGECRLRGPWDDPSAVGDVILTCEQNLNCDAGCVPTGTKVALHHYDRDCLSGYFVGIMNGMANRLRDETSHESVPNRRLSSQDG